jgi:protein O-mannosyl-transferase
LIALGFLAALLLRGGRLEKGAANGPRLAIVVIVLAVAAAFAPILKTPFLYDDYTHITDASRFTWRVAMQQFAPVTGRGLFFRPAGFFLYWMNYLWAGTNASLWHVSSVGLHAVCSCLTFLVCRETGASRRASLGGALLFGLTGLSAETVAWIDARFDLMTTTFVLIALLAIARYAAGGSNWWLVGGLAAGVAGMLCKESGFCFPLLVAALAFFKNERGRIWRAAAMSAALAAALFAYRWWALGGIGGYAGQGGGSAILEFNIWHTANALLVRQWALLFFPFNWLAPTNAFVMAAVFAIPLLLAAVAWIGKPSRRAVFGCIVFVLAAGLPVQHLLLLSPGLSGSRGLYLGSVGWAMLWAVALDSMDARRFAIVAGALLMIEGAILEHNLYVWRVTSDLASAVCASFGREVRDLEGSIVIRGLPAERMGTVFLHNGFPQCVEMNSGLAASRIQVADSEAAQPGAHEFSWDTKTGRLEKTQGR